jgi:hypothetical protein
MPALGTNDVPAFEPVLDLTKKFVTEVLENLYDREDVYDRRIEEVENKSRDGFIPFTDGGFEGIGYQNLSYCSGSGNTPKIIEPYIESSLKDAEEEWDRQNPAHTIEWIFDHEADDEESKQLQLFQTTAYLTTKREAWREKWYEFEQEWLSEGGTFFYKVRALFYDADSSRNQSGKPEVYFFCGINTDFEYGRDTIPWLRCYGAKTQQTDWSWERNVKVSEITEELIEKFVEEATEALGNM